MGLAANRDPESELSRIADKGLLLHIGVHKSGTSSLQAALRDSHDALSDSNVMSHGRYVRHWGAVKPAFAEKDMGETDLDRSVQDHPGRVVVSSEFLCTATESQAAAWVERLGAGRPVKIMVTIRSLADLLPSTWQQKIKADTSFVTPYEKWLRAVIADADRRRTAYWMRNDYPRILQNWGNVVGQANVIFVVSDKTDRRRIMRVTERLLGLPDESLRTTEGLGNRSLPYSVAELIREFRVIAADQLTPEQQRRLSRAILNGWRGSEGDQNLAPIPLPGWAADAMRPIGNTFAEALADSPATIVGDISSIAEPTQLISENYPPDEVPIQVAAATIAEAIRTAPHRTPQTSRSRTPEAGGRWDQRVRQRWQSWTRNS